MYFCPAMCKHILHIDTSIATGVVAITTDGKVIASSTSTEERNHASSINGMVSKVLGDTELQLSDLHAIAVIGGPGSYTGLRIGLATAKGYCYALDLPLMMHNRLDLLALQKIKMGVTNEAILALLPARQEEYFFTLYSHDGTCLIPARHALEKEIIEVMKAYNPSISGVLAKTMKDIVMEMHVDFSENEHFSLDFWASFAHQPDNCNSFVNFFTAEPFYLKHVHTHNAR